MSLVPTFTDLLQPFAFVMTTPTFQTFSWRVTAWLFAPRRTITGMMLAAGVVGTKRHSAFHRVFSAAQWSLDRAGLALFDLLSAWRDGVVLLAVDDTLARKRGLKVFGAGMHLDPIISSRGKKLVNWGHSWVVLSVLTPLSALVRALVLSADPVPAVPEQIGGAAAPAGLPHPARVGRGDARPAVSLPKRTSVSRRGRLGLRRAERAHQAAREL